MLWLSIALAAYILIRAAFVSLSCTFVLSVRYVRYTVVAVRLPLLKHLPRELHSCITFSTNNFDDYHPHPPASQLRSP
jgi:hypothetical protein